MASPGLGLPVRYLIEWLAALILWVCFTFSLSIAELLVGAASAALTVVALECAFRTEPLFFHPTWTMFGQIRKLPVLIVKGLSALICVLWRRMRGGRSESVFRLVRFSATGATPKEAAQRALVISFSTTPPNSIVVGIDREKQQILLHQVKKTALPELIRKLEAAR